MSANLDRKIILVTRKTRLEELVIRFQTLSQAKFYITNLGMNFHEYEIEDKTYREAKQLVVDTLTRLGRFQILDRKYLPNFIFGPDDAVIALGQDGLVANTMKYLDNNMLIGVNPDPYRYDGVLLPFIAKEVSLIIKEVLLDERPYKSISMAVASLNNGQVIHAVNDLFIGPKSHVSARYEIKYQEDSENQSSSGVIVSTGLGSSGWMKSIHTGAMAINRSEMNSNQVAPYEGLAWDSRELLFAVREPFPSQSSKTTITHGKVSLTSPLSLTSHMPENGVIFSDGIEADFLEFNAGTIANIQTADRQGRLII